MGIDPKRSLKNRFPEIAKQWHPTKNDPLTPDAVSFGSNQRVWWQCQRNKKHEWQTRIDHRTSKPSIGIKCPFCVDPEKSLATLSPDIAKQWHKTKNGNKTASDVTNQSNKQAWWQCPDIDEHEWEAKISDVTRKDEVSCPHCKKLVFRFPLIAKEWHPTKNATPTAGDISYGSNEKVWWQCSDNPEHIWDATIVNRTLHKTGCRICNSNDVVTDQNSLASLSPDIAKQWHPTKNKPLKPDQIYNKLPEYDCGLVFIETGEWIRMSSPTKIGEYLSAGLHILGLEGIEVLDRLAVETNCVDVLPRNLNSENYNLNDILKILKKIKRITRIKESIETAKEYYDLKKALKKYLEIYENINV